MVHMLPKIRSELKIIVEDIVMTQWLFSIYGAGTKDGSHSHLSTCPPKRFANLFGNMRWFPVFRLKDDLFDLFFVVRKRLAPVKQYIPIVFLILLVASQLQLLNIHRWPGCLAAIFAVRVRCHLRVTCVGRIVLSTWGFPLKTKMTAPRNDLKFTRMCRQGSSLMLQFWGEKKPELPPWKLTWHWKIPCSNRKYIFKWSIFYCHVSFFGGGVGGGFKFRAFVSWICFLYPMLGGKWIIQFLWQWSNCFVFQLLGVESNNPKYPDGLKLAILRTCTPLLYKFKPNSIGRSYDP